MMSTKLARQSIRTPRICAFRSRATRGKECWSERMRCSTASCWRGFHGKFCCMELGRFEQNVPCTLGTLLPGGLALIRPIAVLIAAMALSRPGIPAPEAKQYASALNEIAAKNKFDPLLAVAMIHYETHWFPQLVSDDGEDHGLGQIRARFIGACREDEDPLHAPSEACQQVKLSLLSGTENIRRMGSIIRANMDFCQKRMGKSKTENWLAGYQGYVDPIRHAYCMPGPKTVRVIDYYDGLISKFYPKPKPKLKSKSLPKSAPATKSAPAVKSAPTVKSVAVAHAPAPERLPKGASTARKQRAEKPRGMPGAARQTRVGRGKPKRAPVVNSPKRP